MLAIVRYGNGLGAITGFVQGRDFNCTADICFAIGPERHHQFQEVQQALNMFRRIPETGTDTGLFDTLAQDGFIGPATIAAGQQVAQVLAVSSEEPVFPAVQQLAQQGMTKEQFAAAIPFFRAAFIQAGAAELAARGEAGLVDMNTFIIPITNTPAFPASASSIPSAPDTVEACLARGGEFDFDTNLCSVAPPAATPPSGLAGLSTKTKLIIGGVAGAVLLGGIGYLMHRRASAAVLGRRSRDRRDRIDRVRDR